jgi:hypothetical protein
MAFMFRDQLRNKLACVAIGSLVAIGLMSCGGGGGVVGVSGTPGGSTTTTGSGSVAIALTDTTGASRSSISGGTPLIAKATVKDAGGQPVENAVVEFAVTSGIAVLSPATGTSLTDAAGIAQIGLETGTGAGAAEITASVTIDTQTIVGRAAFSVGASASATPAAINFVSATPTDKSIVIQGAGGNGRTEVAILIFKVVDSSNNGIANKKVNFSTQSSQTVTLINTSATTGPDGQATATVNSGTLPTTVRVIATVDGTSVSAISDTLTVTTGQPVQTAFSLSVETFNISGWNHDNEKTKINVLMADQSGNPVADGTPVVFQTDSGAVGSSSLGGCVTLNGGCSVDFRSQNPRYGVGNSAGKAPGIATITATSTSALETLTGNVSVILSGDTPRVFLAGNETFGGDVFTAPDCNAITIGLQLRDVNDNPLPAGTKVEAANLNDVTVSGVFPGLVPNTLRPSIHLIPVKPDPAKCAAGGGHVGAFGIQITPPLGSGVLYMFELDYP